MLPCNKLSTCPLAPLPHDSWERLLADPRHPELWKKKPILNMKGRNFAGKKKLNFSKNSNLVALNGN